MSAGPEITRALAPGKRAMVARWPVAVTVDEPMAPLASADPRLVAARDRPPEAAEVDPVGAVLRPGLASVAGVTGWPTTCCRTGRSWPASACSRKTTFTS